MKLTNAQMRAQLMSDLRDMLSEAKEGHAPMLKVTRGGGVVIEIDTVKYDEDYSMTVEYMTDYRGRTLRMQNSEPLYPLQDSDWCEEDILHGD